MSDQVPLDIFESGQRWGFVAELLDSVFAEDAKTSSVGLLNRLCRLGFADRHQDNVIRISSNPGGGNLNSLSDGQYSFFHHIEFGV
jgi:hypothetical protein